MNQKLAVFLRYIAIYIITYSVAIRHHDYKRTAMQITPCNMHIKLQLDIHRNIATACIKSHACMYSYYTLQYLSKRVLGQKPCN